MPSQTSTKNHQRMQIKVSVEEHKLLQRLRQLTSVMCMVIIDDNGNPSFVSVMSQTECLARKKKRER